MEDAYGAFISVSRTVITRKVLARVVQSYEQKLIVEVFKLAILNYEAFQILLYQWDGVRLVFKDVKRKDLWLNRINKAVKHKGEELEFNVALEW